MRRDRGRSQSLSVTATLACLIQAERPAEAGRIALVAHREAGHSEINRAVEGDR
jgi:hypothetical protein